VGKVRGGVWGLTAAEGWGKRAGHSSLRRWGRMEGWARNGRSGGIASAVGKRESQQKIGGDWRAGGAGGEGWLAELPAGRCGGGGNRRGEFEQVSAGMAFEHALATGKSREVWVWQHAGCGWCGSHRVALVHVALAPIEHRVARVPVAGVGGWGWVTLRSSGARGEGRWLERSMNGGLAGVVEMPSLALRPVSVRRAPEGLGTEAVRLL
jgi:hypothetical protein